MLLVWVVKYLCLDTCLIYFFLLLRNDRQAGSCATGLTAAAAATNEHEMTARFCFCGQVCLERDAIQIA